MFSVYSLLTERLVSSKYKYSMSSNVIEMLSHTSLLFFLFSPSVFFSFGERGETFCWTSRFAVLLYHRLKYSFLTKVQYKCGFKICYPLPAVDNVFVRHLRTRFFDRVIIFSRTFSFEMFSRSFSGAPSKYKARMAASQKRRCITCML